MSNMMRDYLMNRRMRDGRNPYGSRGGYVTSRSPRGDRRMGRDYASDPERFNNQRGEDYARGRQYEPIEIMGRFNGYYGGAEDYAYNGRGQDYNYGEDYNHGMDYNYRNDYARDDRRDYAYGNDYSRGRSRDYGYMPYPPYMMDYASQGGEYLSDRDLQMWADKLMRDVEEKDKQYLSKENIRRKAEEMGIKFDKYSFEEFYVVVLMKYTDHCKTLGTANMDIYLKLAKDFFEDPDTALRYGEKLAAYYYDIVEGM